MKIQLIMHMHLAITGVVSCSFLAHYANAYLKKWMFIEGGSIHPQAEEK